MMSQEVCEVLRNNWDFNFKNHLVIDEYERVFAAINMSLILVPKFQSVLGKSWYFVSGMMQQQPQSEPSFKFKNRHPSSSPQKVETNTQSPTEE